MSIEAIARLRERWQDLTFATVTNTTEVDLRPRNGISYTGHAEGISFDRASYHDFAGHTLDFSPDPRVCDWQPANGSMIGGIVEATSKERTFRRWFRCRPELQRLVELVRSEQAPAQESLESLRLEGELDFEYQAERDGLWLAAQLIFFDNLKPVLADYRWLETPHQDRKPYNLLSASAFGSRWFLEQLSRSIEPAWWLKFKELTGYEEPPSCTSDSMCYDCSMVS